MLLPLLIVGGLSYAQEEPTEVDQPAEEVVEEVVTRTYNLQPSSSWLYVVVYFDPDRFTPVPAHDHGVKATDFTGTVRWNLDDASQCQIDISVPVTALQVDPPNMRARASLPADGAVSDGQKETIVNNMRGKKNLNYPAFTDITFKSSSCDGTQGKVSVSGQMTIAGNSKDVTVTMDVKADASAFSANGTLTLNHSDFGMTPFTYGPLTPKNLEKLKFVVEVVGSAN